MFSEGREGEEWEGFAFARSENQEKSVPQKRCEFFFQLFCFVVYIWGAVFLYSLPNPHVCPFAVYNYLWIFYIVGWVLAGVAAGVCIVQIFFAILIAMRKNEEKTREIKQDLEAKRKQKQLEEKHLEEEI